MNIEEFSQQIAQGNIDLNSDYYIYDDEEIIVDNHEDNEFCVAVTEDGRYKFIGPYTVNRDYSRLWPSYPPDNAILFDLNFSNKEN